MSPAKDAGASARGQTKPGISEFAAAKVNLTLEILGRRPDGYHELRSLVAFAQDAGDNVVLTPGSDLSLRVTGPEAGAIEGPNLITQAAEAVRRAIPASITGAFLLQKQLPVASGIGGGSADAAAAFRALARANAIADPASAFSEIGARLGADIPVCIGGGGCSAAYMSGSGEKVWRPASGTLLPSEGLPALLVNPRVAVPTGAVFKALAAPALSGSAASRLPEPFPSHEACIAYVAACCNDLEAPAIANAPVITDVLTALKGLPGCRLTRMSGSGATCFALFQSLAETERAATALQHAQPQWWIKPTRLV